MVVGYDLDPPSQPNLFEAINLTAPIAHNYGDVHNYLRLVEVFCRI